MQVILHFGAHKTGTSLIQKFMRDRPRLMARNGIAALARSETGRLIGWGEERHLARGGAELEAALDRAGDRARHFVISHEDTLNRPLLPGKTGLYPHARDNAQRLRDRLGSRAVRVVHYIRAQPEFVESYYLQTIHEGSHHHFNDWFAPFAAMDLSWRPLHAALVAVFGRENVVLRSFEAEMARGQAGFLEGFFATFSDITPARMDGYAYAPLRNPSIGDRGLAIALAANRHLTTGAERKKMRKFLQQEFSNRDYPRPSLLSEAAKAAMTARYGEENAALLREAAAAPEAAA